MKKQYFVMIVFMAFSGISYAAENSWSEDRVQINLGIDDNGKMAPEAFIPFSWGDGWRSGVGLRSRQIDSHDTITGFSDSRVGTSVGEDRIRLNLFAFEETNDKSSWSFGLDYEQVSIEQLQFGYFQMPDPYTPNPAVAGEYVAFDSLVDVEIIKPNLFAEYSMKADAVNWRIGLSVSPGSNLSVEQETRFVPIVSSTGSRRSDSSQDLAYNVAAELEIKTQSSVNVGISYSYEFLPMQYEISALNSTADGFTDQSVDVEQLTTRLAIRLIFKQSFSTNLKPVIGYMLEDVDTKNIRTGSIETERQNIVLFGLENQF